MGRPSPAEVASESLGERGRRHLLGNYTPIKSGGAPLPVYFRGDGCYLFDDEGRRYLDGLSGLFCVNIGYGREELGEVAAAQVRQLAYFPTFGSGATHPPVIELAERIASLTAPGLERVFFTSGGSESVDSALKLARSYHLARGDERRVKVVARHVSYHGTSLGSLAATGIEAMRRDFEPLIPDIGRHVPNTDVYRLSPGASPLDSARAIEEVIVSQGPETVAAVILEPMQNNGGCLGPPDGYFEMVRDICDRHGVLLISDEVICAWGRLGEMFGHVRYGYRPDIVTTAKGITSGYVPMGAVIASDKVAEPFVEGSIFAHGFTFSGHPVAAAVALRNIGIMEEEGMCEHVRNTSPELRERLEGLRDIPIVGDVRGDGFLFAIELVRDQDTKERLNAELTNRLVANGELGRQLRDRGLIARLDDRIATPVITLSPPLIADSEQFDQIESALRAALNWAAGIVHEYDGGR